MKNKIVKDKNISIQNINDEDYINLTDIVRIKNEDEYLIILKMCNSCVNVLFKIWPTMMTKLN